MSAVLQQWRRLLPETSGHEEAKRVPILRLVGSPSQAKLGRVGYFIMFCSVLALGMVGVLLLNTQIQGQSALISELQTQAKELGYQEAALQDEARELKSVSNLAGKARGLGMVPNPNPAFIYLDTGEIAGVPTTVTGKEMTELLDEVTSQPVTTPSATPTQTATSSTSDTSTTQSTTASSSTTADASASPAAATQQSITTSNTPTTPASASATPNPSTASDEGQ